MTRPEVFTDIDKWIDKVNSKPAFVPPNPTIIEIPSAAHNPDQQSKAPDPHARTARHLPEAVDPDVEKLLNAERIQVNYGISRKLKLAEHQIRFNEILNRCRQMRLQAANFRTEILTGIDEVYQPIVEAALEPNDGHDVDVEKIETLTGVFGPRIKSFFKRGDLREQLAKALKNLDIVPLLGHYADPTNQNKIPPDRIIPEPAVRRDFSGLKSPAMPRLILGTIVFVHTQDAEDYLKFRNISRGEKKN